MNYNDELYHYGVLGMKWGHRKSYGTSASAKKVASTKAAYKDAKKSYNKSFNNAYNHAIAAYSPIKKHRQANDERWAQAMSDANKVNSTKKAYKQAKKENSSKIKETAKSLNSKAGLGEKLMYDNATRKQAAKYIVNNDMPASEAIKKAKSDAWRNSAVFVAAAGAVTLAQIYGSR